MGAPLPWHRLHLPPEMGAGHQVVQRVVAPLLGCLVPEPPGELRAAAGYRKQYVHLPARSVPGNET